MATPTLRPLGRARSVMGHARRFMAVAAAIVMFGALLPSTAVLATYQTASSARIGATSPGNFSPWWCQPPTGQGSEWEPGTRTISGHVTDSAAAGLADIWVEVVPFGEGWGRTASTDPYGNYALNELPDGDYVLKLFDWTGTYNGGFYAGAGNAFTPTPTGAATIHVAGANVVVNVALPAEMHFDVSGWVHDSAGNPVAGAHLDANGAFLSMRSCGETQTDGTYTISGARAGAYLLAVSAPGQPSGYYSSDSPTGFVATRAAATWVTGSSANLTNINIQFPPTFTLSGSVVDGDGNVPEGMYFTACEVTTDYCQTDYSADPSGLFTISTLVEGTYRVAEGDFNQNYRVGYYGGDGVFASSVGEAALVPVSANVTDINLLAVLAPRVSGTISDSAGFASDIYVDLCHTTDIWDCLSPAISAGDGTFTTGGVQPGTYTLYVRDSRDPSEHAAGYLGPEGTLVIDPADASPITVGDTDFGPIDVMIQDGGHIAAMVMKGTELALGAYVIACLTPEICYSGGPVDGTATFTSTPLIAGDYIVGALADGSLWYLEGSEVVGDSANATAVTVLADQTTPITLHMPMSFTEMGNDVEVIPAYSGATNPVDLTFGTVEWAGTTTLTTSTDAPALPTGYQLSGSLYYYLETSAGYSGTIRVCISITGLTPPPMVMLHYDGNDWQPITTSSPDPSKICGETTSLSPFALVTPQNTAKQVEMGPQAMEGDLKVAMGTTLKVGYDFTIPSKHVAQTVSFSGAHVDFAYTCVPGPNTPKNVKPVGSGTVSVPIDNKAIADPTNSTAWYPSAKQADPSVYQGSLVLATDLCTDFGLVRLQKGGTFFFGIASDGNREKINVRWHYSAAGSAGGWSGTLGVVPN